MSPIKASKLFIHRILDQAGYTMARKQRHRYEELIGVPRYREQIVLLNGVEFKIADALSFRHSYFEIFDKEIYQFPCNNRRPRIVDCGSNYGTSVVYFKTLYPDSLITAVECDPAIFEILTWNIQKRGFRGIEAINKAVSTSPQPVRFFGEGADSGRLIPHRELQESLEIETISLDSLLVEPVDFLKIDIEGEETAVICASQRLEQVQCLFVEYHSFVNKAQHLELLLGKISACGFRYYIQTQFVPPCPLIEVSNYLGMDLQLNIFARRES